MSSRCSNVSYVVAHRIADPDSAERLARMAGTECAWTRTERVGGGFFFYHSTKWPDPLKSVRSV